jgi:ribosomal protein S18 acetylase RimI-like enzyme
MKMDARYKILLCQTDSEYENAKKVTTDYIAWLKMDLSFQNIDHELHTFCLMYGEPSGCYLLALYGSDMIAGGVGLRKLSDTICEMKRLYVYPQFAGQGIGTALCMKLFVQARLRRYRFMRLDTIARLTAANSLYEKLGFYDIPPYRENPDPTARFMEIALKPEPKSH